MVLDICIQQSADNMQTKTSVQTVGMIPERSKVAGKLNMAGPVRELTAIDMEPRYPMEPKEEGMED